jgi:lipopolysaccharide/colanic/teichoic acid biosynthesis glycosyltransferase
MSGLLVERRTAWLLKRTFDLCFSLVALVLLSPVFLAVATSIWVTMGRPVLFRQVRAGKGGCRLRVWKFRTMTNARDEGGKLLSDDQRLTKVGAFLRSWSLDELPQFLNVVAGSMSVVGPRPLLTRYLSRYNERQALRLSVKPGITGLAQVSGRRNLDWPSRLELDALYVENWSLGLDLKVVLGTFSKVVHRDGAEQSEEIEFWGNGVEGPQGIRYHPVEEDELPSLPAPPPIGRSA